ncbi:PP2C family serine/threonine-protein phosphatase [Ideonella sp. A 288]|uniref:PP2C family protein-serine/threonine phosphatase n=1 Tax=Ideonella sp. A 288 TaxID=1962181 RepID=UPI000B4BA851|nr:protein phosphatase 2C domain-containing protein [Ideonella sp. A 288]
MLDIVMAARTGQGQRSNNEDSLCFGQAAGGWYAVVADGAGGHRRGAEASHRTIRSIEAMLHSAAPDAFSPDTLSRVVCGAHADLQRHQVPGDPSAAMHSTVVVLWIDAVGRHALWAHVGDSRLYRVRHGLIDMITTDDSVVQQMVTAGLITRDQARHHPHKNQLVAALGVEGEVDPHTVVRPIELKEGDAFLLCSDGWWDSFDTTAIAAALERARSPDEWLALMEARIDERQAPRQDNFTAIAVWAGNPLVSMDQSSDDTVPRLMR